MATLDLEKDEFMNVPSADKEFDWEKWKESELNANDPVNHPSHYTKGGIECIKAIEASMSDEEYKGYLKGNVIKYVWRYEHKEKPVQDLKKAKWYLGSLIDFVEKLTEKEMELLREPQGTDA